MRLPKRSQLPAHPSSGLGRRGVDGRQAETETLARRAGSSSCRARDCACEEDATCLLWTVSVASGKRQTANYRIVSIRVLVSLTAWQTSVAWRQLKGVGGDRQSGEWGGDRLAGRAGQAPAGVARGGRAVVRGGGPGAGRHPRHHPQDGEGPGRPQGAVRREAVADLRLTDQEEVDGFLGLVREANRPGWWHRYRDVLPEWFSAFVSLEAEADQIRAYEPRYVPGLLQTEAYATTVLRAGLPHAPAEEIERLVSLRLVRQDLMNRSQPPLLWVVMDETVSPADRPAERHARPISRLIEAAASPHVRLQIMPFSAGPPPGDVGPFHLFRLPLPELSDVACAENLVGAAYFDQRDDVSTFREALDRMCAQAAPCTALRPSSVVFARRSEPMDRIYNGMPAAQLGSNGSRKPWSGGNGGSCVEAMRLRDGRVALRQSNDPDGPALIYSPHEIEGFIRAAKSGEADFLLV